MGLTEAQLLDADLVGAEDLAEKITDSLGNIKLRYLASDFVVGDTTGRFDYIATDKSALSASAVRLEVNLDKHGNVLGSTLYMTARS